MAWLTLLVAGLFEIGFTTAFRFTEGFTKPWPSVIFVICAGLSLFLLERATQTIPLGTAYAVWTGIGAAGTVLLGVLYFGESLNGLRMFFLATLIISVIGLKLFSAH